MPARKSLVQLIACSQDSFSFVAHTQAHTHTTAYTDKPKALQNKSDGNMMEG